MGALTGRHGASSAPTLLKWDEQLPTARPHGITTVDSFSDRDQPGHLTHSSTSCQEPRTNRAPGGGCCKSGMAQAPMNLANKRESMGAFFPLGFSSCAHI